MITENSGDNSQSRTHLGRYRNLPSCVNHHLQPSEFHEPPQPETEANLCKLCLLFKTFMPHRQPLKMLPALVKSARLRADTSRSNKQQINWLVWYQCLVPRLISGSITTAKNGNNTDVSLSSTDRIKRRFQGRRKCRFVGYIYSTNPKGSLYFVINSDIQEIVPKTRLYVILGHVCQLFALV